MTRYLIHWGVAQHVLDLASTCPLLCLERMTREEGTKENVYFLQYGFRRVHLPGFLEELYLVVVKEFGEKLLMLMTDLSIKRSRKSLWHVVAA